MAFCSEKSMSLVSIVLLIDRDPLRQSRAERIYYSNNDNNNNNNNNSNSKAERI